MRRASFSFRPTKIHRAVGLESWSPHGNCKSIKHLPSVQVSPFPKDSFDPSKQIREAPSNLNWAVWPSISTNRSAVKDSSFGDRLIGRVPDTSMRTFGTRVVPWTGLVAIRISVLWSVWGSHSADLSSMAYLESSNKV